MNYYKHHIGDFDRATRHLTRVERSIYRDLLDVYYDTEKALTLDMQALCRRVIARTDEEATAVEQVLNEFFTKTPSGWYHDRCEEEIDAFKSSNSQKSAAGKASAAKREAKRQQALNGISTDVEQTLNGTPTNHKPLTINHKPVTNKEPRSLADARFAAFWAAYPKKVGKGPAEKAWAKIKPTDDLLLTMVSAINQQSKSEQWAKDGGVFIPNPATWLNQQRWLDELPLSSPVKQQSQPQAPAYKEYRPK